MSHPDTERDDAPPPLRRYLATFYDAWDPGWDACCYVTAATHEAARAAALEVARRDGLRFEELVVEVAP